MAPSRLRLQLILDFDGTITTNDTTAIIGSSLLSKARELASPGATENQLPKPMQYYTDKYMQEYQAFQNSRTQSLDSYKTVDDIVDYHLSTSSARVERDSYERVRRAIFGVPGDRMRAFAENDTLRNEFMLDVGKQAVRNGEVQIRDRESLRRLISTAEQKDNIWGIVSVSWSRHFILGVLVEAGLVDAEHVDAMARRVQCNELLAREQRHKLGRPSIVCSARDKVHALHDLLFPLDFLKPRDDQAQTGTVVAYVGDSSTDLGCLTQANIGFYISSSESSLESYIQTCFDLGVKKMSVEDVQHLTESKGREIGSESFHVLCGVKGFDEIDAWASKAFSRR